MYDHKFKQKKLIQIILGQLKGRLRCKSSVLVFILIILSERFSEHHFVDFEMNDESLHLKNHFKQSFVYLGNHYAVAIKIHIFIFVVTH